jgi:hypothetical protein
MDNPDTKALQEDAEEQVSESTTPVDEPTAADEVSEPEAEATVEAEAEDTESVPEAPKKGAESRIRELNSARKQAEQKAERSEEKAKSLEDQLAELTGRDTSYDPQISGRQQQPTIAPGSEVTLEQYEQDVMSKAQSIVDIQIKQNNAVNRINTEAQEVLRDYPELDPDNETYDKELSESITEATLAYVKSNPYSASPKQFVTRLMKPYKRSVDKEVGKASENLARQVSQAAQRPTSISTKGKKDYSEMSTKELEETLGIHY